MATKIIVSYDGTDNDLDALALGRVLGGAGASLALAYVRHSHEVESGRERLAEGDAKALLEQGAAALGQQHHGRWSRGNEARAGRER